MIFPLHVLRWFFVSTPCALDLNSVHYNVSGDDDVRTAQVLEAVFINSGDNPFELIKDSIKYFMSCFIAEKVINCNFSLEMLFNVF